MFTDITLSMQTDRKLVCQEILLIFRSYRLFESCETPKDLALSSSQGILASSLVRKVMTSCISTAQLPSQAEAQNLLLNWRRRSLYRSAHLSTQERIFFDV